MKKIVNRVYDVVSDKVPETFDNCKICMLSDLHDNAYKISLDRLYNIVDEEKPEFIVFAGDLINRKSTKESEEAADVLCNLAKKYPVFFTNGNHETRVYIEKAKYEDRYERLMSKIRKSGITILNNDKYIYEKNNESINIYGLEIGREYFRNRQTKKMDDDYISSMLGNAKKGFNVLIAHTPVYFENYARWGADLTFSGHMHGGIIRIPGIGGIINPNHTQFPKYDGGEYNIGDSKLLLGRGLGTHTIMIRINNPAEVVTAVLKRKK